MGQKRSVPEWSVIDEVGGQEEWLESMREINGSMDRFGRQESRRGHQRLDWN